MRATIYTLVWALFTTFVCYYIYTQRSDASLIKAQNSLESVEVEVINEVDASDMIGIDEVENGQSDSNESDVQSEEENENSVKVTNDGVDNNDQREGNSSEENFTNSESDYSKDYLEKAYIEFHQNSTKLPKNKQFENYLDSLSSMLSKGNHEIFLVGHTDKSKSSSQNNYDIGLMRAEHIASLLKTRSVSEDQITVLSKGDSSPRIEGDTQEARILNRRVELFIKQKN